MGMKITTANVWTLTSVRKAFISVEERWFQTYVSDEIGAVNDCYAGPVLDHGHVELLGELTESCNAYGEVVYGRIVLGSSELKRCVDVYCYVYSD